jgi:uncharacterized protein DUF6984
MRTLTELEYRFLCRLSVLTSIDLRSLGLSEDAVVEPLPDGGMGSLAFYRSDSHGFDRRFGRQIIEGEFHDVDDMPVSFAVNVDQDGKLFELDLWRVDFAPLKRFPDDRVPVVVSPLGR